MEQIIIKYVKSFIAVFILFIGVGCGGDEPQNSILPNIPDKPEQPEQPDDPAPIKQLYAVVCDGKTEFSNFQWGYDYSKKVVATSYKCNGESLTFDYSSLNKVSGAIDYGYRIKKFVYNGVGLVSSAIIGVGTGLAENNEYFYDDMGRLIRMVKKCGSDEWVTQLTYDLYNIVKISQTYNGETKFTKIIAYTNIPAKTVPLQCFNVGSSQLYSLYESGNFGKSIPLRLIKSISTNTVYESNESVFEYKLDSDGYVIRMKETVYGSDNVKEHDWTFTWDIVAQGSSITEYWSYTNWLFNSDASPYYPYL